MALIQKSDLSTYVQFTTNIPDRLFDFNRDKAENLDFKPLVSDDFWTIINTGSPGMGEQLETFFDGYCKPVIVHFTMLRFMTEAGINVTQFGLVNPIEPTSQPASDTQRSQMRNQYKSDLQAYLNKFYARLAEMEYTFDGVTYDFDCKPKAQKPFIRAI